MDLASINPRLAAVAAVQSNAKQAADAISNLEAQIGLPLPTEYSDFLKDYGALKIQNTDLGWFVVTFLAGDQKVVQARLFRRLQQCGTDRGPVQEIHRPVQA